ncbi:MAG TPA: hypothetical protein VFX89_11715 [Gammaproteobacteria bacterium]|nr:hypothetical protein [Gammaproteobacteria bacterium]
MQTERDALFELLEPPPGGVERMRSRLAEPRRVTVGFGFAAFGVAAVAVLAALIVLLPRAPEPAAIVDNTILAAPELDRLLGRPSAPVPLSVERGDQRVQIEELPSSDPQVRIYRVL